MNAKTVVVSLCAATLVAIISVVSIARQGAAPKASAGAERTFEVAGRIAGLDPDGKTVRIAHDAIPDYMPAMTMPFSVQNRALLKGLAAGDRVQFQLVVTETDSWIARLEKTGSSATPSARSPAPGEPTRDVDRVQVGEKTPDFALIDENGRPVHLSDFRGQVVVLTFVYTRCPIPNFCPLMSKNFVGLQERLSKDLAGRFHLLSVSIDPEFDRPEILKSYAARYAADPNHWSFATGTAEQIDYVANLFGLTHEPENGLIAHDLRTALIKPDGTLAHVWKSNVWTPYEAERLVRETLEGTGRMARR